MGLMHDAAVVNIEGNTKQLVDQINKADKAMQGFDKTLTEILKHLTDVENGLKNVNSITNNASKISNSVQTRYNRETYDFGKQSKIVKSSSGFISSESGREKAFREYQQAVIKETKEITADIAERKRLRQQRADAERTSANAARLRVSKLEDQSTAAYQARMDKLADAKLLNAQNGQAGALNRNWRYQGGKMLDAVGGAAGQFGVGGRIVGNVLESAGALLKAPAAGLMAIFTKLGQGMIDFSKAATQAYAEIEAIKTQLGVVFSNQTQADAMFGQISQYAVKSPFGVQQTSELAVLLKQSGVYASDLMDTLRMIGDTAGGNMEKMKRIANNYAQIVSIGKASMLDMRQFAYAGIPIFEAVSKELNVSQQELRKLISDGKVTSDIIEKVFKDLTGINGIFENATAKGAKTLKARLQNLQDAKQLALSSAGEYIVNYKTQTGNDSWVNNLVSWAEKIYQDIHDNVNTKNIEKDVSTIASRENRIKELSDLQTKFANNDKMLYLLQKAMGLEISKRDADKDRAVYEASYLAKVGSGKNNEEINKAYNDYKALLDILTGAGSVEFKQLKAARSKAITSIWASNQVENIYKDFEARGFDLREIEKLKPDEQKEVINVISEAIKAIEGLKDITEEELKAHKETIEQDAQQLAFDEENKRANDTKSLNSSFQELLEITKNSDEYKKKEEEKRVKVLTEAQEILKRLSPKADSSGLVDLSKFSMGEFLKYDAQGAFSAGKKFDIVNGSKPTNPADMAMLKKQFGFVTNDIKNLLYSSQDFNAVNALSRELGQLNGNLSDTEYLDKFGTVLSSIKDILSGSNVPEAVRNQMLGWLQASTISHELTVGGENANPDDILKGSKQEFIPLWKRILAQYTGLSTLEMTSTADTMKKYSEDMAIRNMTSNVMSATMKSMGIDTAMRLVSAGGAKQLKEDSAGTLQVNWKQTQENIKKFSLALSASTDVVSAYKKSLEDELEVYQQLIVAGYTQGENQNGGESQFISVKKLAQYAQSNEQLVNAFGDTLETASGNKYNVNDLRFTQEGIFDKFGNKIDDQVKVTSNLSRFIESILPKIYQDLHEANVAEAKNTVLNKMFSQAAPTQLASRFLNGNNLQMGINGKHLDAVRFLQQYPDFADTIINSSLTTNKNSFPALKGMSNTEILTYAYRTKGTGKTQVEEDKITGSTAALTLAFSELERAILDLVGTDAFENLKDALQTQARDEDVMKRYLANQWFKTNGLSDQNNLTPENYGGARGLRNRFYKYVTGTELASDKEDYIATKLRADPDLVRRINEKRLENRRAKIANNPDYQPKELELIKAEDLDPLKKTNEELAKMLSLSEEIAMVWGEEGVDIAKAFDDIGSKTGDIMRNFTASAISSTFETWGKTLTTAADDSNEIGRNLASMSASMLKNMGTMITQAGLSLAISNVGDKAKVLTGLAIAAAGGGLSFLGGMIDGATEDNNKEDDEWQKLLKIKQDLADLLKQAREDAIYYENTVRHKKAISANENFTKSVHDAIITPRGDIVTTDPKDYLIATKTPRTLVGGGAPTINFSVIDKSTGVRVTQQRSNYDERTNTIEFEAILENKIQEVIATSKGDEAFAARESRLNGRTVIA